ncbi:hypothetical protein BN863_14380 [Formosa agariphila KMM 3901]|uniref:SnoaL-like domain-containing protein n=1 Tax=Formosa agariphila (strain DSM 15362 / KCTC 12365 / LMG 23005 / KMM 3901 / M-2Alg 35-1) TaxID=1347342 RepID=T2KK53_FORAG|nr:hypothetical protein BN863_14380 [Formosa agariphila KMM 3901]
MHDYFKDSNYEGLKELYAEDAQIYENSLEPSSVDDMIKQGKEGREFIEAYDFPNGVKCEMITNDAGEKWVNSWAVWSGNVKGSTTELKVPIISRFQFKDGKIVKEYSYWDNLQTYNAFEEVATEKLDLLEERLEEDQ